MCSSYSQPACVFTRHSSECTARYRIHTKAHNPRARIHTPTPHTAQARARSASSRGRLAGWPCLCRRISRALSTLPPSSNKNGFMLGLSDRARGGSPLLLVRMRIRERNHELQVCRAGRAHLWLLLPGGERQAAPAAGGHNSPSHAHLHTPVDHDSPTHTLAPAPMLHLTFTRAPLSP